MEEIKSILIEELGARVSSDALVVIDSNVWALYQNKLQLTSDKIYLAPGGEKAKDLAEYHKCIEFFLKKGVHRNCHLVAIGGGAVCDMGGFVAATLLRGISWSVFPTTLLAMVDSCLGGKVAINASVGKNLIGAFHRPQEIVIALDFLDSLSAVEIDSGKGEILKYCFLSSEIFNKVTAGVSIFQLVELCLSYKKKITERDFEEKDIRKFLNFGHTLGHIIERQEKVPHGLAVMMGIYHLFQMFDEKDLMIKFDQVVKKLDLGKYTMAKIKIVGNLQYDKKVVAKESIDLVRIKDIGKPYIETMALLELEEKVKKYDRD